jgi:hypothetical protein
VRHCCPGRCRGRLARSVTRRDATRRDVLRPGVRRRRFGRRRVSRRLCQQTGSAHHSRHRRTRDAPGRVLGLPVVGAGRPQHRVRRVDGPLSAGGRLARSETRRKRRSGIRSRRRRPNGPARPSCSRPQGQRRSAQSRVRVVGGGVSVRGAIAAGAATGADHAGAPPGSVRALTARVAAASQRRNGQLTRRRP